MAIKPVSNTQSVPIDFFSVLPDDALSGIFSKFIQSQDICSLLLTNRRVSQLISNEGGHWKILLKSRFPFDFRKNPNPTHPGAHYNRLKIREKNIRENKYLTRTLIGHDHPVEKFAFHEGMFISCDRSGLIKGWDSKRGTELFTLEGHGRLINCLAFDDSKLGSLDEGGTLKFWDLKNGKKKSAIRTLRSKGDRPRSESYAVHEGKSFSIEAEHTLKICDLENGEPLDLLTDDNKKEVQGIAVHKGKLILSYGNETIKVFDLKNEETLYTLTGNARCGLTVKGDYLIADSGEGIKVWDLNLNGREAFARETEVKLNDIQGDLLLAQFADFWTLVFDLKSGEELFKQMRILGGKIQIQEGMLILGGQYGSISGFDLKSKEHLNGFRLQEPEALIAVQGEILVSSGWEGDGQNSIQVIDLRSGTNLYTLETYSHEGVKLLAFHEGVLYAGLLGESDILAWDFNKSPEEFLGENLSLLKALKNAVDNNFSVKAEELCQKMDPHFQKRVRQYAFNKDGSAILNVQTEVCLELLLDSVRREDQQRVSTFLRELFKIGSQNIKLCEYLSEICGHTDAGWGECAFHGEKDYPASFEEKEKAVLKFQMQLLLIDLGLVSEDDYLRKLQCSPEDLEKVGILSREDLLELEISSVPAIAHLGTAGAENQTQLEEGQKKILVLLTDLSELVARRYDDSRGYSESMGFLDQRCPWDLFAKQFEEKAALIKEKCQFTQQLSENYSEIIADVNALLDEFNVFDRQNQIAKLYLYLDQEGLEERWTELNEEGIYSLAEFVQQEEGNPYLMAEKERIPHPSDE